MYIYIYMGQDLGIQVTIKIVGNWVFIPIDAPVRPATSRSLHLGTQFLHTCTVSLVLNILANCFTNQ